MTADVTASGEGGSGSCANTACAEPASRKLFVRITSCSSATRRTSGSVCASSDASEGKRCMQRPQPVRPARPRRCLAAAREINTSSSEAMRRSGSYLSSLTRPESMTKPTSSMVIDVSATLVARTTLITPPAAGGRSKTLRCSSGGRVPWRHRTHSACVVSPPKARWPAPLLPHRGRRQG